MTLSGQCSEIDTTTHESLATEQEWGPPSPAPPRGGEQPSGLAGNCPICYLWNLRLGPSGVDDSRIPAQKPLPGDPQLVGNSLEAEAARPGRRFLAGLEHLLASISARPGQLPAGTTLKGLPGSLPQFKSGAFFLGDPFLLHTVKLFSFFLKFLPKSNYRSWETLSETYKRCETTASNSI